MNIITRPRLIILLVAFVVLGMIIFVFWGNKGIGGITLPQSTSSNILFLTQPVYSFSGIVERVGKDSFTVSQKLTLPQTQMYFAPVMATPDPRYSPTPIPTPVTKNITYTVKVIKETQITRPTNYIPYLLKQQAMQETPKLSISDVKTGQNVNIQTSVDLRTLLGSDFAAVSVQLPAIQNTLSGTVVRSTSKQFTLRAFVSPSVPNPTQGPKEQDFTVVLTPQTEISRQTMSTDPSKPPQPEKLSASDIKPNMQLTVYTDGDVTASTTVTALLVILPQPPTPTPSPPAAVNPLTGTENPATTATPAPTAGEEATPTPTTP